MVCLPTCPVCATRLLVGASLVAVHAEIVRFGDSLLPLLLEGETGTGKGCAAEALHRVGRRAAGPLVRIGCGELPRTLLESELFGHEKGAFTGATEQKIGLIESAAGGTVFFDELDALAPDLQPRLLHVLQHRALRRVGGLRDIAVDVRFVCATNKPLDALSAAGHFRADLLFRASAHRIALPPLRDRRCDIPELALFLRDRIAPGTAARPIAERTLRVLARYGWPGNVRELEHAIAVAMTEARGGGEILPEHLPALVVAKARSRTTALVTRERVEAAIAQADGDLARAAPALCWSLKHLYKMMRMFGIPTPGERKRETRRIQAVKRREL